jgi:hypothetical protein
VSATARAWRAAVGSVALAAAACGGEAPAPQGPRGVGAVEIATVADGLGPGADLTTIDAHFERAGTRTACTLTEHGACQVYAGCVTDRPDPTRPDAGELAVETGDGRFSQILNVDASGAYSFGDESDVFAAGDEITATFAGGEVPAFAVVGTLPEALVLTEPLPAAGESDVIVAPDADVTFRWTGGVAGTVFSVSQDVPSGAVLRCAVPSPRAVLTVPSSALAALESGRLDVRTVKTVAARAGSYDVTLVVSAGVVDEDGEGVRVELVR